MISNTLLGYAADSYGFDKADCQFVTYGRQQEKQLYTFHKMGEAYVLRLVKDPACRLGQTIAEMDWLLYLANKGIAVPRPLRTENGSLAVTARESGETYILSAFRRLEGLYWDKEEPALWNKEVFRNWGKTVGSMHRVTKDYVPAGGVEKLEDFDMRRMMGPKVKEFPALDRIAGNLWDEIRALPKDGDAYGLIHNDLHPNNFLINGACISLFDFDGCAYSWYAFDIANALYLALWLGRKNQAGTDFTNDIIRSFLQGYGSVNPICDFWKSKIPLFMMACKIALFSLGCDSETPSRKLDGKSPQEQLKNIENNVLFSDCAIDTSVFFGA